jgi:hypothetical protein
MAVMNMRKRRAQRNKYEYDEPEEVMEAIDDTPPAKKTWKDKVKGYFIKSDEEIAMEREADEEYERAYVRERKNVLMERARSKAKKKAQRGGVGGGLAASIKDALGSKRKKRKKKRKNKYVVVDGKAYPLADQTSSYTRKEKRGKRKLSDVLMGEQGHVQGGDTYNFKTIDDILLSTPRNKKKKHKSKNPLDMLGRRL